MRFGKIPHVLFLFLDGVGIGPKDGKRNPFFHASLPTLTKLLGGTLPSTRNPFRGTKHLTHVPIDANLGMPGLPQSGTGQTAILTGINAAKFIGKHFGPYPYSSLRTVLQEESIFQKLSKQRRTSFYANAFPPQYFAYVEKHPNRMTAMSYSWESGGGKLSDHHMLIKGEALSADLTSEGWNAKGFPHAPVISTQEAGCRLVKIAEQYNFTLYEYYLTDHAGHGQSMDEAVRVLQQIDSLVEGIADTMDHSTMLFFLSSDHGNLEDLSTKSHTRNPVPLLAIGRHHREFTSGMKSLTDITPGLVRHF